MIVIIAGTDDNINQITTLKTVESNLHHELCADTSTKHWQWWEKTSLSTRARQCLRTSVSTTQIRTTRFKGDKAVQSHHFNKNKGVAQPLVMTYHWYNNEFQQTLQTQQPAHTVRSRNSSLPPGSVPLCWTRYSLGWRSHVKLQCTDSTGTTCWTRVKVAGADSDTIQCQPWVHGSVSLMNTSSQVAAKWLEDTQKFESQQQYGFELFKTCCTADTLKQTFNLDLQQCYGTEDHKTGIRHNIPFDMMIACTSCTLLQGTKYSTSLI